MPQERRQFATSLKDWTVIERERLPLLHNNIRHRANIKVAVQFIPDQVPNHPECLTVRVAWIAENDWPAGI